MFLIVFNTGHALLLTAVRVSRPRSGRGEEPKQPQGINRSWPHMRQIREREQAQYRTRTRIVHVREQSMSTFSPRQHPRQQPVHVRSHARTLAVRAKALAMAMSCPQTVRTLGPAAAAVSPQAHTVRGPGLAGEHSHHRIALSSQSPTVVPFRIRIISAYVHV